MALAAACSAPRRNATAAAGAVGTAGAPAITARRVGSATTVPLPLASGAPWGTAFPSPFTLQLADGASGRMSGLVARAGSQHVMRLIAEVGPTPGTTGYRPGTGRPS